MCRLGRGRVFLAFFRCPIGDMMRASQAIAETLACRINETREKRLT